MADMEWYEQAMARYRAAEAAHTHESREPDATPPGVDAGTVTPIETVVDAPPPQESESLPWAPPSTLTARLQTPSPHEATWSPLSSGPAPAPVTVAPRRVLGSLALATAVLVVGSLGAYFALSGGQSASAAVSQAITDSLADHSADVTMTMTGHVSGQTFSLSGTGATDFVNNKSDITMQINAAGRTLTEHALYDGQTIFINLGDLVGYVLPGKSWLSMDVGQLGTGNSALPGGGGGDPTALLHVLGAEGNTVTPLGGSVVNGDPVQGYAVRMTRASLDHAIAQAHLPSWMTQAMSLLKDPNVTYDVYINGANRLERTSATVDATVQGQKLVEDVQMDFSNYGMSVSITDPPSDQVASFDQFMQAANQLNSSTTT
jgi:hypothetical protein